MEVLFTLQGAMRRIHQCAPFGAFRSVPFKTTTNFKHKRTKLYVSGSIVPWSKLFLAVMLSMESLLKDASNL